MRVAAEGYGCDALAGAFQSPVDGLTRASDRLLNALVLVLAAWTVIYSV